MKKDLISEISIIEQKLIIRPHRKVFEYVYRAAMEVNWDAKNKVLYSPVPKDWEYIDWFKQIYSAVLNEYGCFLEISQDTVWNNIPEKLKTEILGFYNKEKTSL